MKKVVHKFHSFEAADTADDARYRDMSGEEKLQILIDLVIPEDPNEAVIQRSARVYPLGGGSQ